MTSSVLRIRAVLMVHRGATDKSRCVLNAARVGMSSAPLDRSASSQHGRRVIQMAAGKPETAT
ncbi:hypothetical protein OIU35_09820 [Boseaceae bacterium BT-24-1]|nr:hypothetical protein [Boseaceae bacterium BT-24-1]